MKTSVGVYTEYAAWCS